MCPAGTTEYRTIFAVGATLFVFTFIMNLFSQRLARKVSGGSRE